MSSEATLSMGAFQRLADIMQAMGEVYQANDPAKSRSGTPEGIMRREGRRDVAVQVASLAIGGDGSRSHGEHVLRSLGFIT